MENYIVINGKKAELTEEQLEKLGIKIENPEEKYPAKFKVGDRVKVHCSTTTLGRPEEYDGKIFTIERVYRLSDYPNGPAPNIRAYSIGGNYVVYENELELFKNDDVFKRVYGEIYHHIDEYDDVWVHQEYLNDGDARLYDIGNYCKDEVIMKQRALHETLNRLLWRASVIAGELNNEWNANNIHYFICYNAESASWGLRNYEISKVPGVCYFPTRDSAENALENIVKPFMKEHPDFVW